MQFINGSVPFGYSLNSGFDTGNDSWFSSGAWQVGTPVQKMPSGTGALGGSRGPRGLGDNFLWAYRRWSGSQASEENPFPFSKKRWKIKCSQGRGPQHSLFFNKSDTSPHMYTNTVPRQDPQREMVAGHFNPVESIQPTQARVYHRSGLHKASPHHKIDILYLHIK
ncbi:hypothetical protein J4Q44_G00314700 [Coregonus suidteri]|uniref:Uncharacterized protein n=1 Tax=Coregonus suidteri TaxID=861788 RepID=A0AAN8QB84_9TELE